MTRRTRRRAEAVLALLAFPVAVALTVLTIVAPPPRSGSADERHRGAAPADAGVAVRVAVRGGDPVARFGLGDALAAQGYDVAVGGGGNALPPATEIVYYRREDKLAVERLRNLLGVGTIRREQAFSPNSDVTIHIGKDLDTT